MLEEKIFNDYKEAMRNRDILKSSTLSFLRAAIMNVAIEKRKKSLGDEEIIAIIKKQIKQHKESIEQFKKADRQDLVDKETQELKILETYLPPQLSVEEIKKIIEETITALGAQGPKDMGRVMKEIMPKVSQQADAQLVSDLVRSRLSG